MKTLSIIMAGVLTLLGTVELVAMKSPADASCLFTLAVLMYLVHLDAERAGRP